MTRDVEFAVTASDKTGAGLASAEAKFKASQDRMRKESQKTGDGVGKGLTDGIGKAAPGIVGKLNNVFKLGGATGGQFLAVGLTAAAPVIGAAISAAIIGGAGAAGVLGGVALVADHPQVKAAGGRLASNLMSDLREDASGFVEPVLNSIGKVEARWDQMRGKVQRIFANASGFLDPLVDGALDGVDGILRGIDSLVARGGPVMDAMGDSFGILGDSIGDAMETISGGSEDAGSALRTLATFAGETIKVLGYVTRALTEVYGVISYIPSKGAEFSNWLGSLVGIEKETTATTDGLSRALELSRVSFENNAEGVERTNQYLADSEKKMRETAQATRDLTTANQNLYGSETSVAEAAARAKDALAENGRTLDVNSAKGRANREALLGVAQSSRRVLDEFIKVNGEGARSSARAGQLRGDFVRLATAFTGSASKANKLADEILGIPASRNTKINADPSKAIEASRAAKAAINSIHSRNVNVNVIVNTRRLAAVEARLNRLGGSMYNAAGMSWAAAGGGVSRVGGPSPVNATVESHLYLDGSLIYQRTDRQVRSGIEREAWRAKVGTR